VGHNQTSQKLSKSVLGELTREKLNAHLGKSNLDGELAFFHATAAAINPIPSASQGGLFERPYGFAWLLELQTDLRTWPDTQATRWAANVAPLAAWMADSLGAYFTKLVEPVRAGSQNNTAQSMTLALDYADVARDTKLRGAVVSAARKLYLADTTCATQLERVPPAAGGRGGRGGGGGRGAGRGANADSAARAVTTPNDLTAPAGRGAAPPPAGGGGPEIFSPCLSEAALMARVLESRAYLAWLDRFLPPLHSGRFAPLTEQISFPVAAPAVAGRGGAPTDTSPQRLPPPHPPRPPRSQRNARASRACRSLALNPWSALRARCRRRIRASLLGIDCRQSRPRAASSSCATTPPAATGSRRKHFST
jgi:hypothetical protein